MMDVLDIAGLIEALNEATLDPHARTQFLNDPMAALGSLGIHIPDGLVISVVHSAEGLAKLVLTSTDPTELPEEMLDSIVGGAAMADISGALAVWDLAA